MRRPSRAPRHSEPTPDPAASALAFWSRCVNLGQIWWTRHGGLPAGDLASVRLNALVRHARSASPFYRRLYGGLPEEGFALKDLPSVDRAGLMASFDDWVTDSRVRLAGVERFLADRRRVGDAYLGRYHVWKSSGTSGTLGIFLQDAQAMAVYDALVAAQFDAAALGAGASARFMAGGGRAALVIATGDHFASITSWEHLRRAYPGTAARSFSVLDPMPRIVAELNGYQPAFLASYPSVLALLARERAAGRLAIAPAVIWSGGEFLGEAAKSTIERAFDCRVMNEYGASECLSIAYGCREGWLHVNDEWVIVEGVDERGRPTPAGALSHTVLLTNLANRLQPIIRYDLGDRIVALPTPCACGNPQAAIRVEGRKDATLEMRGASGARIRLPPLALSTVVEEAAGERRFQIARIAPDRLVVRFEAAEGRAGRARIWRQASRALRSYLCSQSLDNVRLTLDRAAPRVDARSGKLHAVTVEDASPPPHHRQ